VVVAQPLQECQMVAAKRQILFLQQQKTVIIAQEMLLKAQ
jgi:hypothetical protein